MDIFVFNEFDKMLSDLNIIAEDIFPKKTI